jgi:hypothetical protein
MSQEGLTAAQVGVRGWVWLRDAATLVLVWLRAFVRLGGAMYFTLGVLALLLAKSLVRAFGHPH